MAFLGGLFGGLNLGSGGIVSLFVYMALGLVIISLIALTFFLVIKNRRKWFLNVEFKIPRADGNIVTCEWGKGTYDAKRGVVFVKRPGKKQSAMKPFDVKKFLQSGKGKETLTVIQVGIDDYRPVMLESFLEMVDDKTGQEAVVMKIKIDTTESRAWKESFEREAKNAYSLQTLIQQYASYIGFGILFFSIFVGFAILWGRIK